jgi:flavin-binding protein dodecin
VIRLVSVATAYFFVAYCAFQIIPVATASPEDVDKKAARAINNITETGTNLIVDEVKDMANPINLIGDALSKDTD